MMTYLNTFCNVRTKVLTYSQLHSLTQGFGLGPDPALLTLLHKMEESKTVNVAHHVDNPNHLSER